MKRPFVVTLLAILSGLLAVFAGFVALRWLGVWFSPTLSSNLVPAFWYALMYGLLAWVYIWLTQMLWNVQPAAWLFLAVITVFNLIIAFLDMLSAGPWGGTYIHVGLNAVILLYVMLPGTKRAFGMDKPQPM